MYLGKKVLVLIPARGGSKRIPNKNTKLLKGKPLIYYAIRAAKGSRHTDKIIVSTDSKAIASIASRYGAEIPFLRPKYLATDTAPVIGAILHALSNLRSKESWEPDIVVLVQATSPFVRSRDIDEAVKTLIGSGANSCVSVSSVSERPEWMFTLKNKKLRPLLSANIFRRSQDMQPYVRLNGAVNATRTSVLRRKKVPFDPKSLAGFLMPRGRSIDIDTPEDLALARALA